MISLCSKVVHLQFNRYDMIASAQLKTLITPTCDRRGEPTPRPTRAQRERSFLHEEVRRGDDGEGGREDPSPDADTRRTQRRQGGAGSQAKTALGMSKRHMWPRPRRRGAHVAPMQASSVSPPYGPSPGPKRHSPATAQASPATTTRGGPSRDGVRRGGD